MVFNKFSIFKINSIKIYIYTSYDYITRITVKNAH